MDDLFDCLAILSDRPLGTVVHVGAGNGPVLEHYARLAPARAVLVEGDPDAAAQLQRRAAACNWAEVQAHPVAAQSGPLPWHRYNLPMLNGPLEAAALGTYYPRLRLAESRTLEAVALTVLLQGLNLRDDAERIHVLVLDVPGQEDALLAALPQDQLNAFGAVLLRSCREALPGGAAPGQGVAQLRRRCYQAAVAHAEQESLWPVTLLRFDSVRYQTEQLQQRIDTLEAVLGQREQTIAELQAECVRLTDTVDVQQRLSAERQAQLQTLTQAHANLESTAQQCQAQIDSLVQAKAADEATAAERAARIELLIKERDEQAHRHQKNTKRVKSLQIEVEALRAKSAEGQAQRQALTQAKAELEQAAQARRTQIDALSRAKATAETAAAEHGAQVEHLSKVHDEQAQLAVARQTQLQLLTQANADLENTVQEYRAQISSLIEAKAAAEGTAAEHAARIELLIEERDEQTQGHQANAQWARSLQIEVEALRADLAERQTQLQELMQVRSELEKVVRAGETQNEVLMQANATAQAMLAERLVQIELLTKARDEHAQRHQENAKWALGLKAENATLIAEQGRLRTQIDGTHSKASELEATNKRLIREGQDRDARQRLLDSEIVKAEAQLELIKDVLLREKNF